MGCLKKEVLATYYSDARVNILACLNDIAEKMGKTTQHNDAQIRAQFNSLDLATATPETQAELIKQLRRRFRFIDVFTDRKPTPNREPYLASPENYQDIFQWLLKLINNLRNATSHAEGSEKTIDNQVHKELHINLNKVYDAALRVIEQRYQPKEKVIKYLRRHQGRDLKTKQNFFFFLCDEENQAQPNSYPSEILTDFGHVFLCSLFLDKNQSSELIDYFWKAHKENNIAKDTIDIKDVKDVINELIAVYRTYPPLKRLKTVDSKHTVTIDTLAELTQCPRQLLNHLSKKDIKKHFRATESEVTEVTKTDNTEASTLFLRSHRDRFIPLMMRFFDFDETCKLRFAIDLGHLYYNVRLNQVLTLKMAFTVYAV